MSRAVELLDSTIRQAAAELRVEGEGGLLVLGRPPWAPLQEARGRRWVSEPSEAIQGGIAFGAPAPSELEAWFDALPVGGIAAHVFAASREGARGALERVSRLGKLGPALDAARASNALFLLGLRRARLVSLDPWRGIQVLVGQRRS